MSFSVNQQVLLKFLRCDKDRIRLSKSRTFIKVSIRAGQRVQPVVQPLLVQETPGGPEKGSPSLEQDPQEVPAQREALTTRYRVSSRRAY